MRMSSIVIIAPQQGQVAPARDIVPSPTPLPLGGLWSMPNSTPVPSALGVTVSTTRFLFFLHNHVVLSRGTVARQFLQVTVRAQR